MTTGRANVRLVLLLPVRTVTGGGFDFLLRVPVHDCILQLIYVQQNVQFIQTVRFCFQLIFLEERLLCLYLCTGKLGFIGGQVVLGGFQEVINITEQIIKLLDVAVNTLAQDHSTLLSAFLSLQAGNRDARRLPLRLMPLKTIISRTMELSAFIQKAAGKWAVWNSPKL